MLFSAFKVLTTNYLSKRVIFMQDLFLSLLSSVSLILLLSWLNPLALYSSREFFLSYMLSSLAGSALLFLLTRCYQIIIRHLSVRDIVPFSLASAGKSVLLLVVLSVLGWRGGELFLLTSLDFFLTFFLLLGIRVVMILIYEAYTSKAKERAEQQRILVYDTSDKSLATLVRLRHSDHYRIMGFLLRGKATESLMIDRVPVYSFETEADLDKIVKKSDADAVLFSKDTDAQHEEDSLIKYCSEHKIKTLIVPNLDEVGEGESFFRPREVKIEDLLGREEIKISMEEIVENFRGKVVMVTGAAGSIGSELCRQLATFGVKKLVLFDNAETPMHNLRLELEDRHKGLDFIPIIGDVRQERRLDYVFRTWHPQVVFHAAAYKHVPLMEENPCEAVLVNVYGSRNVADKCVEYEVEKMVMVSTDKAVNPTNIMGCTKRLAEIYVQSLGLAIERGEKTGKTKFVTTRFGNVLGSNGSVIPRFREQIAKGGPVTVTDPRITRFFMTIPEACRLVMEAATMSTGNQIFVFDMGESVKIDTLARRIITLAGFRPDVDIKVEYTGLRPGEKLYEEVLATSENTLPAFHERIRIAVVRDYAHGDASQAVDELERLSRAVRIPDMVRLMKRIVPEYKSENSKYAEFDDAAVEADFDKTVAGLSMTDVFRL